MTRDEMFSMVVSRFGFEHHETIRFWRMAKILTDRGLAHLYKHLMKININSED